MGHAPWNGCKSFVDRVSVEGPVLMLVGFRQKQSRLLPQVGAPPGQSNHSICKPAQRPCLGN